MTKLFAGLAIAALGLAVLAGGTAAGSSSFAQVIQQIEALPYQQNYAPVGFDSAFAPTLFADMPRKSVPGRSGENGLHDRFKAGVTGVFCTQQTQLSISSELPAAGFPAGAGTGSGPDAAVSVHCAANSAGALSRSELCGRTWL